MHPVRTNFLPQQVSPIIMNRVQNVVKVEEQMIKIEENNQIGCQVEQSFDKIRTELTLKVEQLHTLATNRFWTQQEDYFLLKNGKDNASWKKISKYIPNSNREICKRRYKRLRKKNQKWTKQLDWFIKREFEVKKRQWKQIAFDISNDPNNHGRYTGSVVRDRYYNHLREGIKRKPWTVADDLLLCQLVWKEGNVWSRLVQKFDGKTELQLKNRWHGILKPIILPLQKREKSSRSISKYHQESHEIIKKETL